MKLLKTVVGLGSPPAKTLIVYRSHKNTSLLSSYTLLAGGYKPIVFQLLFNKRKPEY